MPTYESWSHGETVDAPQMAMLNTAIAAVSGMFLDFLASTNVIVGFPSGVPLTPVAGSPIKFSYPTFTVYINGIQLRIPSGTITLSNGDATYHRYDSLYVQYTSVAGTDSQQQVTAVDTGTALVNPGAAAGSPVVPALPINSLQVAWIDVPNGATTAASCVVHQAQGSDRYNVSTLVDLTNHLNASLVAGIVHGVQASGPGGILANSLAQQDGSGRVWDSNRLAGHFPGGGGGLDSDTVDGQHAAAFQAAGTYDAGGAAAAVQTSLNTHTAVSHYSGPVHGVEIRRGQQAVNIVSGNGDVAYGISFSPVMQGAPQAITFGVITNGSTQVGALYAAGVTASGFTLHVSSTGTLNATITWTAIS